MKTLKANIDTWNALERNGIEAAETDGTVQISDDDFRRMLDRAKNKQYILNLQADRGRFCTHGFIDS